MERNNVNKACDRQSVDITTFLNATMAISFLQPQWLLISFFLVVFFEAGVMYLFLKDWKKSVIISLVSNFFSMILGGITLAAIPIISEVYYGQYYQSFGSWMFPIFFSFSFFKTIPSDYNFHPINNMTFFIALYLFTFLYSIFIEFFFVHYILKANADDTHSGTENFVMVTLANLLTYCSILLFLFLLGIILGLSSSVNDPGDCLTGWFFSTNYDAISVFYFWNSILGLLLIPVVTFTILLIVVLIYIWRYLKKRRKNTEDIQAINLNKIEN